LIELLQDGDGEGGGLACAGLSLGDDIAAKNRRLDGALLDCGGLLEAIGEDPARSRSSFRSRPSKLPMTSSQFDSMPSIVWLGSADLLCPSAEPLSLAPKPSLF